MPNKTATKGVFFPIPEGCMKKKGEGECGDKATHYTVDVKMGVILFAIFACSTHAEESNNKRKAQEN